MATQPPHPLCPTLCDGTSANSRVDSVHQIIQGGYDQLSELASKTCVPCRGGVPPLAGKELEALATQVPQWTIVNGHHVTRAFKFPDFVQALAFVNKVGAIAEQQGHHPDILLTWGKAEVTMWTHKINGLTESDFILAAKIDKL
jgi:4a-hydroxytetrahydrobiopterin dehydratase